MNNRPVGGDQTWTIATHNVAETMYKIRRKKYFSECGGQGGICRGGGKPGNFPLTFPLVCLKT